MSQAYKIDRLNLITYKCQKKKIVKSLRCRYMAKSHVVNCNAQMQTFDYVNFRGSHFTKVNFKGTRFYGCDFWGTTFSNCNFDNANFSDCVFVACKFKNCRFNYSHIRYSTIVNTNLSECHDIDVSERVALYRSYPSCVITDELKTVLSELKNDRNLKKNKLLFISDSKYNHLNLFLLQKRYGNYLPHLLQQLKTQSTATITTYKKLERILNRIHTSAII